TPEMAALASFRSRFRPSPVRGLFFGRGPIAILWRIRTVIISTFQSETGRLLSHMRKEIYEVHPRYADCYSSSAVKIIRRIFWIGTSAFHRRPNPVGEIRLTSRGMSVA